MPRTTIVFTNKPEGVTRRRYGRGLAILANILGGKYMHLGKDVHIIVGGDKMQERYNQMKTK